jgi:hypothetical protein
MQFLQMKCIISQQEEEQDINFNKMDVLGYWILFIDVCTFMHMFVMECGLRSSYLECWASTDPTLKFL